MSKPVVTLKNTKQEIYDALLEAKETVKALKENNFDPVQEATEKENVAIVESARESVKGNLFSEELSKKFSDLEAAIEIKTAELKEMYGIEKELQNITTIVNAGKELAAKLDADKATKEAELRTMISDMMADYEKKRKEALESFTAYQADLKKQREREVEEYEYNLKRSRDIENDKWADEMAVREAVIAEKETKAQEMYDDAQSKVDYIAELEAKIEAIPEMIETAKSEATEAATKEAAREYGYKKTMAEKENSYAVQRLEDKLDSLSAELEKATTLNDSLQEKLDNAYEQIRELATKTVESTGGVKILNGNSDTKK